MGTPLRPEGMDSKDTSGSNLKEGEITEVAAGHVDMSNTPASDSDMTTEEAREVYSVIVVKDIPCYGCKTADREFIMFCGPCFDLWHLGKHERQIQSAKEKAERIASYAGKRLMNIAEWANWLRIFDHDSGQSFEHMQFTRSSYYRWGCEMPYSANLGDHGDLEHAFNCFSCERVGPEERAHLEEN